MKALPLVLLFLSCFIATAQLKTWDGGASTHNWEDANNWNPNGVPSILNDVEIDNDSVSISSNQTVKSIILESTHPTLTDQAILLQNGATLSVFNGTGNGLELDDEARFWNAGSLVIVGASGSGLRILSGTFENMANQGAVAISLCNEGITNSGTFQNRNNADIDIMDVSGIGLDNTNSSSQFSNRGEITISEINIGVNNAGTLLNRGDLFIDNVSYIGMVTLNYFKNFSNGLVTLDSLDDEGVFASYDFINEGDLTIKTAMKNGIEDTFYPLDFVNAGYIYISKTEENGIHMDTTGSVLHNMVGGEIVIDSTTNDGISVNQKLINDGEINISFTSDNGIATYPSNVGSVINNGLINISNSGQHGVAISGGPFENELGAEIVVESVSGSGILSLTKLLNKGSLTLSGSGNYGLQTSDTLVNHGQVKINDSGLVGFFQQGYFMNNLSASLEICNSTINGISAFGKFTNEGIIEIGHASRGLLIDSANTDSLQNEGEIHILNSSTGIVHEGAFFYNASGGEIVIDTTSMSGFLCHSKLINDGSLIIKNNEEEALDNSDDNSDSLINNGLINIQNSGFGISNKGFLFLNGTSGEIEIDSTKDSGFYNKGKLLNEGSLRILRAKVALENFTGADSILNNGVITILYSRNDGFWHFGSFMLNGSSGEIIIDSIEFEGITVKNSFENKGLLQISNTGTHGLVYSSSSSDTLINKGHIKLSNSGNFEINCISTGNLFLNDSCGQIEFIGSSTLRATSSFLNKGLIRGLELTYLLSSDTLVNEGVFNINPALGSPLPTLFKNSGLIIRPGSGSLSEGLKEMSLITAGSIPLHTVSSTWWTDEGKTIPAGTYNNVDASFTPNMAGKMADTLWLELDNGFCVFTIKIPLNQEVDCTSIPTYTFTGEKSTDWHNPGNWSFGYTPSPCTKVVIPIGENCTITTGRKARAYNIEVEAGSVFDAELGAVLDVNPSN